MKKVVLCAIKREVSSYLSSNNLLASEFARENLQKFDWSDVHNSMSSALPTLYSAILSAVTSVKEKKA